MNNEAICKNSNSCSFASDSSGQLDILWHNCHSLCMDSAEVGIFEKAYKIGFSSFLKGEDCLTLESEVTLVFLGNFSH